MDRCLVVPAGGGTETGAMGLGQKYIIGDIRGTDCNVSKVIGTAPELFQSLIIADGRK